MIWDVAMHDILFFWIFGDTSTLISYLNVKSPNPSLQSQMAFPFVVNHLIDQSVTLVI